MEEEVFSLSPISFFQLKASCNFLKPGNFPGLSGRNLSKHTLPNTSYLCGEEHFADIALGWNSDGIEALVTIQAPLTHASISRGDSVELFFDTRDVKSSGYNTRFCHHFFFLPEAIDGQIAGEITKFRTEDVHELCDPNDLQVKTVAKSDGYQLHIFIPAQCLYGYDPEQFDRFGFTYRINRATGKPQHLSVVSDEYQLEQQPSLWSSLRLAKY